MKNNRNFMKTIRRYTAMLLAVLMIVEGSGMQSLAESISKGVLDFLPKELTSIEIQQLGDDTSLDQGNSEEYPESVVEFLTEEMAQDGETDSEQKEAEEADSAEPEIDVLSEEDNADVPEESKDADNADDENADKVKTGDDPAGTGALSLAGAGEPVLAKAEGEKNVPVCTLYANDEVASKTAKPAVEFGSTLLFSVLSKESIEPQSFATLESSKTPSKGAKWERFTNPGLCLLKSGDYYVSYGIKYQLDGHDAYYSDYSGDWMIHVDKLNLKEPGNAVWNKTTATWEASDSVEDYLKGYTIQLYRDGVAEGASVFVAKAEEQTAYSYDMKAAIEAAGSGVFSFTVTTTPEDPDCCNASDPVSSDYYNRASVRLQTGLGTGIQSVTPSKAFILVPEDESVKEIEAAVKPGFSFTGWTCDKESALDIADPFSLTTSVSLNRQFSETANLTVSANAVKLETVSPYSADYDAASHNITASIDGNQGAYTEVSWNWQKKNGAVWQDVPAAMFTDNVLQVKNVADSGEYKVIVTFSAEGEDPLVLSQDGITVTINQTDLTVKVKDKTITYGDEAANDGVTYLNTKTKAVVSDPELKPEKSTLTYSYGGYKVTDPQGTYDITVDPSAIESANYKFNTTIQKGTLTVNKKTLTVCSASVADHVFDGKKDANVLAVGSNLIEEDQSYSSQIFDSKGTFATAEVGNGINVTVKLSIAGSEYLKARYELGSSTYTAKGNIIRIKIKITADAKTKVHGEADPEFTYTVDRALYGTDTLSGKLSRNAGENAGKYDITQGTLTDANNPHYQIEFVSNKLEITKNTNNQIEITETKDKPYDGTPVSSPEIDAAKDYNLGKVTFRYYTHDGKPLAATPSDAGTYYVEAVAGEDDNYTEKTSERKKFTIDKAKITVTAKAASKVYGEADPVFGYDVSPALFGTDELDGALTREKAGIDTVGTYDIERGTLGHNNYDITFKSAKFTISKGSFTPGVPELDASSWEYDGKNKPITVDDVPAEAAAAVYHYETYNEETGKYEGNETAQPVNAGKYQVWAVYPANSCYEEVTTGKTPFEITKRPLTIISGSETWEYDGTAHSNTEFSYAYTGKTAAEAFPGNEGISKINLDAAITDAGKLKNEFTEADIEPKNNTRLSNYDLTLVQGDLVVDKIKLASPSNASWNAGDPGSASWVQVSSPVIGQDISYEVTLCDADGVKLEFEGNPAISKTSVYDFSALIRKHGKTAGTAGEYTFKVRSVIMNGDELNASVEPSDAAACTSKVCSVKTVIDGLDKATVTVDGEEAYSPYYFIAGETVSINAKEKAGHELMTRVWKDNSTETGLFTITDPYLASTKLSVKAVTETGEGSLAVQAINLAPEMELTGASDPTEGMKKVNLTLTATDDNDMVKWALTNSWSKPKDSEWQDIPEGQENAFTTTVTKTIEDVSTEKRFYFHILDEYGTDTYADSLKIYVIKFDKAAEGASGEMQSVLKAQGDKPVLPKMNYVYQGFGFQNWTDSKGNNYADQSEYTLDESATLTAKWEQTQYKYTVTYLYENLKGEYVEPARSETADWDLPYDLPATKAFVATYSSVIRYDSEVIKIPAVGLSATYPQGSTHEESITITEQDQHLTVCYGRNTYKLSYTFKLIDGTEKTYSSADYKYGKNVAIKDPPETGIDKEYEGYNFVGWVYPDNGKVPVTMPAKDVNVTGQLIAKETTYYINYYTENADGSFTKQGTQVTRTGLTGDLVAPQEEAKLRGFAGQKYDGYMVSEGQAMAGTVSAAEYQKASEDKTALSGKSKKLTYINLFYKRYKISITLRVVRTNAAEGEDPVYEHTWSKIGYYNEDLKVDGEIKTAAYFETYEMDKWMGDKYSGNYEITDAIGWNSGTKPTKIPSADTVVTRYIRPVVDKQLYVDLYLMDYKGDYPAEPTLIGFMAYADASGVAPMKVVLDDGTGSDPAVKYINYNGTEFRSQFFYSSHYEIDTDAENVLEITRKADEGFNKHLKIYMRAKTYTYNIRYYYNDGVTIADKLFKTDTVQKRWGTKVDSKDLIKYFDGSNDSAVPGATDYKYRENHYLVYYYVSSSINGSGFSTGERLINSVEDLQAVYAGTHDASRYGQQNNHDVLTVIYRRLPTTRTYRAIDIYYNYNMDKEPDQSVHPVTASVVRKDTSAEETLRVRYADKAYVYGATYTADTKNYYPGLGDLYGEYTVGTTLPSPYYLVTYKGKDYASDGTYLYVLREGDPVIYDGKYVSIGYPNDDSLPGVKQMKDELTAYKSAHSNPKDETNYDFKAKYYSYAGGSTSGLVTGDRSITLYFHHPSTSTYYHIANGEKCSGHSYVCGQQVEGEEAISCAKDPSGKNWKRGEMKAKWYYDSLFERPVTTTNKSDAHSTEFFIYGKYVYDIMPGKDYAYYYIPGTGYVKNPGATGMQEVDTRPLDSVDVVIPDGGGDDTDATVTTKKYYYTDSYGIRRLALVVRDHPAVAYSDVNIEWTAKKKADSSTVTFSRSDFDAGKYGDTGYGFNSTSQSNVTAGVPTTVGCELGVYYSPNQKLLTWDITNEEDPLTTATSKALKYYTERVVLPNPTKTGYAFTGWTFKDTNGTTVTVEHITKDEPADSYAFLMPNQELIATANWAPAPYDQKITYHYQDANLKYHTTDDPATMVKEIIVATASIVSEAAFAVADHKIPDAEVRHFFEFEKMTVKNPKLAKDNVIQLDMDGSYNILPGMEVDYYYKRVPDVFTVVLNQSGYLNGDSATLTGNGTYYLGQTVTSKVNYNEAGYVFDGWFLGDAAEPLSKDLSFSFPAGMDDYESTIEWWPKELSGDPVASVTLTAKFTPKEPDLPEVSYSGKDSYTYAYYDNVANQIIATVKFPTKVVNPTHISGYKWYECTEDPTVEGNWKLIAKATGSSYHFPSGKGAGTYYYRCDITVMVDASKYEKPVPDTCYTDGRYYTVTVKPDDMIYNASGYTGLFDHANHSPVVNVTWPYNESGYTVMYRNKGEEEYSSTVPAFKNVGTYPVEYYIKSNSKNFNDVASKEKPNELTVKILPAEVVLKATGTPLEKTYDGTTAVVLPEGAKISDYITTMVKIDGVEVTVDDLSGASYNKKNVKDARYVSFNNLKLTGINASNYTFAYGATTASFTVTGKINPLVLDNEWSGNGNPPAEENISYSYDGNKKTPGVILPAGYTGTCSVIGGQIDAGTYTASATLTAIARGGIADEISNYSLASPSKAFKILPNGTMDVEEKNYSQTYDGMYHSARVTVKVPSNYSDTEVYYGTVRAITAEDLGNSEICSKVLPSYKNVELENDGTLKEHIVYYYVKDKTGNYADASGQLSVQINPAAVKVVSGITAKNKKYDGNTVATLSVYEIKLSGNVPGETLALNSERVTGAFESKDVGNGKKVAIAYDVTADRNIFTTGGIKNVNYVLATEGNQIETTANIIDNDEFTASIQDVTLTYDGTEQSYTTQKTYTGYLDDEKDVVVTYSTDELIYEAAVPKFKTAGTYTVYFKANATNYAEASGSFTVKVKKKDVEASWKEASGISYEYDGLEHTVTPTLTLCEGDKLGIVHVNSKKTDVGSYTAQVIGITASEEEGHEEDYKNYNLTNQPTLPWSITSTTAWEEMVGSIDDQVYTGSNIEPELTIVYKTVATSSVLVKNKDYTVVFSNNRNVTTSTSKAMAEITFKGNFSGVISVNFNIIPKELTVSWPATTSFEYTGAAQSLTATLNGIVSVDKGKVNPTYSTAEGITNSATDAGDYKAAVTTVLTGDEAGNYTLKNENLSKDWKITKKALTVTWKNSDDTTLVANKTYNGTVQSIKPVLGGIVTSDAGQVDCTAVNNAFATASSYTASVSELKAAAGATKPNAYKNYALPSNTSQNWSIGKKTIHVTGVEILDKTYDASTAAQFVEKGSLKEAEIEAIDKTAARLSLVTSGAAAVFSSASAGKNKTVNLSGYALDGEAKVNYSLVAGTAKADINKISGVVVSNIKVKDKIYDGTTDATTNNVSLIDISDVVLTNILDADKKYVTLQTANAKGTFDGTDVQAGRTVTFTHKSDNTKYAFSLTGDAAGNYELDTENSQKTALGNIVQREVTITWSTPREFNFDGNNHSVVPTIGNTVQSQAVDFIKVDYEKCDVSTAADGTHLAKVTGLSGDAAVTKNYKLPDDPKKASCSWAIKPVKLATPGPTWSTEADSRGKVTWNKVSDITGTVKTVKVASYEAQLWKLQADGKTYAKVDSETKSITRTEAPGYSADFGTYMHANAGTYKVYVVAIPESAADGPNPNKLNVLDSDAGKTAAARRSALVTLKYASDEDTISGKGTSPEVQLGTAAAGETSSLIMVEGENFTDISAKIKNITGYNAELVTDKGFESMIETKDVAVSTALPARVTGKVRLTTISDTAAKDGINVYVKLPAKPAVIDAEITGVFDDKTVCRKNFTLTYGYKVSDAPVLTLSVYDKYDKENVTYTITNYQWVFQHDYTATDIPAEQGGKNVEIRVQQDLIVSNDYWWGVKFTATRNDNGKSVTITDENLPMIDGIVERAHHGDIQTRIDRKVEDTWVYGNTDVHALSTTDLEEEADLHYWWIPYSKIETKDGRVTNIPVYNSKDEVVSSGEWVEMEDEYDLPEDVGTYAFTTHVDASKNYDGYTTNNICTLIITKAKLATPEPITVTVAPPVTAGDKPQLLAEWDPVPVIGKVTAEYTLTIFDKNGTQVGDVITEIATNSVTKKRYVDIYDKVSDTYEKYTLKTQAVVPTAQRSNCDDSEFGVRTFTAAAQIKLYKGTEETAASWTYDGVSRKLELVIPTSYISCQWYKDGTALTGKTEKTLPVTYVSDSGYYCCEVETADGERYSNFIHVVISARDIADEDIAVTAPDDSEYDKNVHKNEPKSVVYTFADKTKYALIKGTDYTLEWQTNVTDAGEKKVTLTGTGNFTGSRVATYSVTRRPVTVKAEDKTKTYGDKDPKDYTYAIATASKPLCGGDSLSLTYSRETGENVGSYKISPSQNEGANPNYAVTFITDDANAGRLTITPKEIKINWGTVTFVYDGTEKKLSPVITNLEEADKGNISLVLSGDSATNVAEYTAEATGLAGTGSGNYKLTDTSPKTCSWNITQAPNAITKLEITGWTYGDKPNAPTSTANFGQDTVKYSYSDKPEGPFTSATPSTAGTWYVKADIAETTNYQSATKTISFTISKKVILIDWGKTEFIYDKTVKKLTPSIVNLVSGDEGEVELTLTEIEKTNAGDYTANATGLTGSRKDNYELTAESPNTKGWKILPRSAVEFTIATLSYYYFTGSEIRPKPEVKDGDTVMIENVDFTYTYENNIQVGTATVIAHGKGNYDEATSKSTTFEIINTWPYTVQHYQQTVDGTSYVLQETENKIGEIGLMTEAAAKDYTGFNAKAFAQKKVEKDKEIVVRIDYDRKHYKVYFATPSGAYVEYDEKEVVYGGVYGGGSTDGLPEVSRTGYTFHGWYTEPDGGTRIKEDTEVGDIGTITLYPRLVPNTYKVRFGANGATAGTMADQTLTYDKEEALTKNGYVRKGYTWRGWATESDAKKPVYENEARVKNLATASNAVVDLYAVWTINSYNVSFDLNGGSGTVPEDRMVTFGEKIAKPADPTRNGYRFTGWMFNDRIWNFDTDVVEQGMKLVAQWTPVSSREETIGGPGENPVYVYNTPNGNPKTTVGDWELLDPKNRVWKLKARNGEYVKGGWAYVKNPYTNNGHLYEWFFFDENGIMQYGWIRVLEPYAWYYANAFSDTNLGMMVRGWHDDPQDGFRYYLDPVDGKMHTGWTTINGKEYYFETVGLPEELSWYRDLVDANVGLKMWQYRYIGGKPLGSMYRNELTPDGHFVDENGVKVR